MIKWQQQQQSQISFSSVKKVPHKFHPHINRVNIYIYMLIDGNNLNQSLDHKLIRTRVYESPDECVSIFCLLLLLWMFECMRTCEWENQTKWTNTHKNLYTHSDDIFKSENNKPLNNKNEWNQTKVYVLLNVRFVAWCFSQVNRLEQVTIERKNTHTFLVKCGMINENQNIYIYLYVTL